MKVTEENVGLVIKDILEGPNSMCASFWLKDALKKLNERDVVDVLADLDLLHDIFQAQFRKSIENNY